MYSKCITDLIANPEVIELLEQNIAEKSLYTPVRYSVLDAMSKNMIHKKTKQIITHKN